MWIHKPITLSFHLLFLALLSLTITTLSHAKGESLKIYLDADTSASGGRLSSTSIERGIRTALSEINNVLCSFEIELIVKNHRGNNVRSKNNLKSFLNDDTALVLFGGMHSPPLLAHREFINENQILVLDPWAAAGPITKPKHNNNWIFRCSIDDSNAGQYIAEYAIKKDGFKKPVLLLEETGWGRSNYNTMSTALEQLGVSPTGVKWFNWGLSENHAEILLKEIIKTNTDVIFLVANAREGQKFIKNIHKVSPHNPLPIISHWGITGGNFYKNVGAELMKKTDIKFIQTKFSFFNSQNTVMENDVIKKAASIFPDIKDKHDITAPTGFIHAYDLTKIFIAAANQSNLSGDVITDRRKLKNALENLKEPVHGLIKTYSPPFREYHFKKDTTAHEALNINDYRMGRFTENGNIELSSAE